MTLFYLHYLHYLHYLQAIFCAVHIAAAETFPEQAIRFSQALPEPRIVTFDPSWFSDSTTDSTYILIDGDLSVTLPVPEDVSPPPTLEDLSAAVVSQTLPPLLQL